MFFFAFYSVKISLQRAPVRFVIPGPSISGGIIVLVDTRESGQIHGFCGALFYLLLVSGVGLGFSGCSALD